MTYLLVYRKESSANSLKLFERLFNTGFQKYFLDFVGYTSDVEQASQA